MIKSPTKAKTQRRVRAKSSHKTAPDEVVRKSLYVVMPAKNEASVLGEVLAGIPKRISGLPVTIVVVDDGSVDATPDIIDAHPGAVRITHVLSSGAGAGTRTGINYAVRCGADYILTMDSDGQHHQEDLVKVAKALVAGKADFVIGSRLIDASGMPWYRRIGNIGLSTITFVMFGAFVTDSQSGLKGLTYDAAKCIRFYSDRYAFSSEMIWRAKQQRLKIIEVPIRAIYTDYSLGKGQANSNGIHLVLQLAKQRLLSLING